VTPAEWQAEVVRRIKINEGYRNTVYRDSLGIPTVGVGFNLQRDDARSALASIGADYDAVMNGAALSDEQVDKLLAYSLAPIVSQARNSLAPTHFDSMSDARRFVLTDLVFNLGEGGWLQFVHTRWVIDEACHEALTGDPDKAHAYFGSAADALEQSAWFSQVGDRARRDVAMMRSSGWVDANGSGA
jgi:GH24 family phage-related lysozyme (muramidase)